MAFSVTHPANALLPGYQTGDYSQVLYRWNYVNTHAALGTPAQVSFSFMTQRPSYYAGTSDFVNFHPLTSMQMDGARAALARWAEVANLSFTEVADNANSGMGGQIRFGRGDTSYGGYTYYPSSSQKGGDVLLSNSASYLDDMTPGKAGFTLMLHELGHALGLGHSFGDPPDLVDFGIPDTDQYSLMSYNHVPRSYIAYYVQNGGSYSYGYSAYLEPETPMVYDIAAMQILYGANMTTRTGNDVYSFDTSPVMLRTIWDAGGTDTIDLSNQHRANIVNMNPGSYSSIGFLADPLADWPSAIANSFKSSYPSLLDKLYNGENNLGIAFDTLIENVIGGSGDDQITGNAAGNTVSGNLGNDNIAGLEGNDTLTGGAGNDTLSGGLGVDTAIFSALRSVYSAIHTGPTWTVTHLNGGVDGTDTLTGIERLQFSNALINLLANNTDYNNDAQTDILWRNSVSNEVVLWQMDGTGAKSVGAFGTVASAWQIVDSGSDYNADGKADLLWRNSVSNEVVLWQMDGTGAKSVGAFGTVASDWQIVDSSSDYNADGKADLLWRNSVSNEVVLWQMDGAAGKTVGAFGTVASAWQIVDSSSDYNADGKADILWRNDTTNEVVLWQMDGAAGKTVGAFGSVASDWQIVDSGSDYNADGKADLLWRNSVSNEVVLWQMNGTGAKSVGAFGTVGSDWQIVDSSSDYNADGKADILWRNDTTNEVVLWQMDGAAGKTVGAFGSVASDWQIVDSGSDYNADGKADLLWRNSVSNEVVLWQMNGTGAKSVGAFGTVGSDWQIVDSSSDYNADGKADILWRNDTTNEVVLWQMDGTGAKSVGAFGSVASDWMMVMDT